MSVRLDTARTPLGIRPVSRPHTTQHNTTQHTAVPKSVCCSSSSDCRNPALEGHRMDLNQTRELLKVRAALTSQPYGDTAVEAWHAVLAQWTWEDCRYALGLAARTHDQVTPAHLVELLPNNGRRPENHQSQPTMLGRTLALGTIPLMRAHQKQEHPAASTSWPHDCEQCQAILRAQAQEEEQDQDQDQEAAPW